MGRRKEEEALKASETGYKKQNPKSRVEELERNILALLNTCYALWPLASYVSRVAQDSVFNFARAEECREEERRASDMPVSVFFLRWQRSEWKNRSEWSATAAVLFV